MSPDSATENSSPGRTFFSIAAIFNWLVAVSLVAPGGLTWKIFGMPEPEQKLFLHLFAVMVAVFGLAYWWIGRDPAGKRSLIELSIVGKLAVFVVVVAHYLAGSIPIMVVPPGVIDLVFGIFFIRFLRNRREIS